MKKITDDDWEKVFGLKKEEREQEEEEVGGGEKGEGDPLSSGSPVYASQKEHPWHRI